MMFSHLSALSAFVFAISLGTPGLRGQHVRDPIGLDRRALTDEAAVFIENRGQWPGTVRYRLLIADVPADITEEGVVLRPTGAAPVRVTPAGFDARRLLARDPSPTRYTAFGLEGEPASVGAYRTLRAPTGRGGTWVLRASPEGVRYDLELSPGSSSDGFVIGVEGARCVPERPGGGLVFECDGRPVARQSAPVAWQTDRTGRRHAIGCVVEQIEQGFRFRTDPLHPDRATTIDPLVHAASDFAVRSALAIDWVTLRDDGVIFAAGGLSGSTPPIAPAVFTPGGDNLVMRIDPSQPAGAWMTHAALFGEDASVPGTIALDPTGSVVVVGGATFGSTFPTTDGSSARLDGEMHGYVLALDAETLGSLVFGTVPTGLSAVYRVATQRDASGHLLIAATGTAVAATIPGEFTHGVCGGEDVVVQLFDASATTLRSTARIGGVEDESGVDIAFGPGHVFVCASAARSPETPAAQRAPTSAGAFPKEPASGGRGKKGSSLDTDAYLIALSPDLAQLEYATFVGGSGSDQNPKLAAAGSLVAVGMTTETGDVVPMASTGMDARAAGGEVHLTVLDFSTFVAGAAPPDLLWATYLGGDSDERLYRLAFDGDLRLHVAGRVQTGNGRQRDPFPLFAGASGYLKTPQIEWTDGFCTVFSTIGTAGLLTYSTLVGGVHHDLLADAAVASDGSVCVVFAAASDVPLTDPASSGSRLLVRVGRRE